MALSRGRSVPFIFMLALASCSSSTLVVIGEDLSAVRSVYVAVGADAIQAAKKDATELIAPKGGRKSLLAFAQVLPRKDGERWVWGEKIEPSPSPLVEIEIDGEELAVGIDSDILEREPKTSAVVIANFTSGELWRVLLVLTPEQIDADEKAEGFILGPSFSTGAR